MVDYAAAASKPCAPHVAHSGFEGGDDLSIVLSFTLSLAYLVVLVEAGKSQVDDLEHLHLHVLMAGLCSRPTTRVYL